MKTSYTPGPWKAEYFEEKKGFKNQYEIQSENNGLICYTPEKEDNKIGFKARHANAKLIAAAPDLLEALIELCAIAEDDDNYPTFTEKAMKAIKKAYDYENQD